MHEQQEGQQSNQRGQMIVLFAISLFVIVAVVGLVIDGGYAWSQRRASQNASDLAALAGARVVGSYMSGDAVNGTDANVQAAINNIITANGAQALTYGAPSGPRYVGSNGALLGYVGSGMPANAAGVTLSASRSWRPFFLGIIGVTNWSAAASATAKSGYHPGSGGGNLLPIAVSGPTLFPSNNPQYCPPGTPASSCTPINLTGGSNGSGWTSAPGQFGWMSWNGTGNTPYLCSILGPPASSPVYAVPPGSYIILPGNTGVSNASCVRSGIDAWVAMQATILVPYISPGPPPGNQTCAQAPDYCYPNSSVTPNPPGTPYPPTTTGQGSKATYNVLGFVGFQLTGCTNPCIKNLSGVFRKTFFLGPTTSTQSFPGQPLGLQLVR